MATEQHRVIFRHPRGIYETVEVMGEAIGAVIGYIKRHKERVKNDGTASELIEGRRRELFEDLHRAFIAMHSIAVEVFGDKLGLAIMDKFADMIKDETIKRECEATTSQVEYE